MTGREYNRDDFWTDDGVMFARALAVLSERSLLSDDAFAIFAGRMGLSSSDAAELLERAAMATQAHDDACDEANAAYRSDPANVYGTEEHEMLLMEEERGY